MCSVVVKSEEDRIFINNSPKCKIPTEYVAHCYEILCKSEIVHIWLLHPLLALVTL